MPAVIMDLLQRVKRGVEVVATTAGSVAKEAVQNAVADTGAAPGPTTVAPSGDGSGVTEAPKGIDKLKNLVTGELSKRKFFSSFICNRKIFLKFLSKDYSRRFHSVSEQCMSLGLIKLHYSFQFLCWNAANFFAMKICLFIIYKLL